MNLRTTLALTVVALAASAAAQQTTKHSAQQATQHEPPIIDIKGYEKILQEYHGKPLLVTFWATWCEPCRDEYPMVNELAKQYAPKGLHVVGVDRDQEGDLILMRRFLARYKPIFPNYRKGKGSDSAFEHAVSPDWNGSMPATFFYDKDGKEVGHFFGAKDRGTFEAAINAVLSSSATAAATP